MPLISLVMPARNAEATLADSLETLTRQTFDDFELVLVDDGSTDATGEIAARYAQQLKLRVIVHADSQGVARSINDGVLAGDSEFVARLDADDLALPARLERQLEFLRANRSIGVCGSHMQLFRRENGKLEVSNVLAHPLDNAAIRTALVQRCAISHPSLMCRREVFELAGYYDVRFDFAEDYELWCRASLLGVQFANIPEILTCYRKHPGQVGQEKAYMQYERDLEIKKRYIGAWLQESPGILPKFLSLQTKFPSREAAMEALQQCSEAMIKLARTVPDLDEYARIVSGSMARHMA